MKKLFPLLLSVLPVTGFASSLDLNFSDESMRLTYAQAIDRHLVTDAGLLYLERKGRFKDDELALHLGLNAVSGNFRLGGRVFFATPGTADVLAVGFGGQARVALSAHVGLGGHFYYAPKATSFADAKGYHEFSFRLDYSFNPTAFVYLGYRNVKVSVGSRSNEIELDDNVMLGFKLYF